MKASEREKTIKDNKNKNSIEISINVKPKTKALKTINLICLNFLPPPHATAQCRHHHTTGIN